MEIKQCKKCNHEKSLINFTKVKKNKDGLCNYCKDCIKIIRFEYRKNNKKKLQLKDSERYYRKKKLMEKQLQNIECCLKVNPDKIQPRIACFVKKMSED